VKHSLTFPPSCGNGGAYPDSGLTRQAQGATRFTSLPRRKGDIRTLLVYGTFLALEEATKAFLQYCNYRRYYQAS